MGKMKKSIKVIVAAITVLVLIYFICVLCAWFVGHLSRFLWISLSNCCFSGLSVL